MQFTSILSIVAILGAAANAAPAIAGEATNSTSLLAPSPESNSWAMSTWTGTSCQGTRLYWTVPDGYSCTNLRQYSQPATNIFRTPGANQARKAGKADDVTESVTSLKVTNFGGCSTYYYTGSGCQGSPQHVDTLNSCDGYAQGDRIGSFSVNC